jgi:hypothetical protein
MAKSARAILSIHIAPVADADDQHDQEPASDLVNNSIVADPNPPQAIASLEFFRAPRTWFIRKRVDTRTQISLNLAR